MSDVIHQPHDKVFKLAMSDQHVMREFVAKHVPLALLRQMNLDTLKLENHSFVDETYRASEADVIYSVQLQQQLAYVYILCEQQTVVDSKMALRLLAYTVRLMERHTRQHPESVLPLVYPVLVYSGGKPWDAPLDIFPLFGKQEALARDWLLQPYQVVDIQRMSDAEIDKNLWFGVVEFALKYRRMRDFKAFARGIFSRLNLIEAQNSKSGLFLGRVILEYILSGVEVGRAKEFLQGAEQYLSGKLRGEAMTLAEQFEEIGEQRGLERGRQEGRQEGELAVLTRQIQRRFGAVPLAYIQRLKMADADTVLRWSDRVLEAKTIEEVFTEGQA